MNIYKLGSNRINIETISLEQGFAEIFTEVNDLSNETFERFSNAITTPKVVVYKTDYETVLYAVSKRLIKKFKN